MNICSYVITIIHFCQVFFTIKHQKIKKISVYMTEIIVFFNYQEAGIKGFLVVLISVFSSLKTWLTNSVDFINDA